jgi:hypothetical protein
MLFSLFEKTINFRLHRHKKKQRKKDCEGELKKISF